MTMFKDPCVHLLRPVAAYVPFVGSVCPACLDKLQQPIRLEGCVDAVPFVELAAATEREIERRAERMRKLAAEILSVSLIDVEKS